MIVSTDDCGIDVTVFIDLCAAHKPHIDVAPLKIIRKDIVHAHYRERTAYQCWIPNRQGQTRRFGTDHTRLVDHYQVGCVSPLGEVAGQVGLSDPYKDYVVIAQQA